MAKSTNQTEDKKNKSESAFNIMRCDEVKARIEPNQRRNYYFDDLIDLVLVQISKKHVEPDHLHTENTEFYLVIRGKLLLNVEGEEVWLSEGDLLTVNPGACHHFETTAEEVLFLAIKKKPGLDDKKRCGASSATRLYSEPIR